MRALVDLGRGFAVVTTVTLVLGAVVVAGATRVGGEEPTPTTAAAALAQTEADAAEGTEAEEADEPATLGDVVEELRSTGLAETFEVYLSRDPFQPVVVEAAADGGGGGSTDGGSTDGGSTDGGSTDGGSTDGGSTDGGSTDGGSTDGGSTDGGSTDGGSSDGGGTSGGGDGSGDGGAVDGDACAETGEEAVCDGAVVTLIDVDDEGRAVVEVNGVTYTVGPGETFATSFRVERIDTAAGCAFLRFGDEAFTICVGATVLK